MSQPLKNKLSGNEKEILSDVKLFGDQYAMEKWQVKDFVAWRKWIHEQTGDINFGMHPALAMSGSRDLGEQIVDALAAYVLRSEAEKHNLKERVKYLEMQLNHRGNFNQQKIAAFLEVASGSRT